MSLTITFFSVIFIIAFILKIMNQKEEIDNLNNLFDDLTNQLSKVKAKYESEKGTLQYYTDINEKNKEVISELQQTQQNLQIENDALKQQIDTEKLEVHSTKKQLEELSVLNLNQETELRNIDSAWNSFREKCKKLEQKNEQLMQDNELLDISKKATEVSLLEADKDMKLMKERLLQTEKILSDLQISIKTKEAMLIALQTDIAGVENANAKMKENYTALKAELISTKGKLKRREQKIVELNKSLEQSEQHIEEQNHILDHLREETSTKKKELAALKQSFKNTGNNLTQESNPFEKLAKW